MLSDQGSPYVGRFARGWRRLPGMVPGQPQTRTRARSSIGRSSCTQERPGSHEQRHARRTVCEQHLRARGRGRPGGEHVVDQEHVTRHGHTVSDSERPAHRRPARVGISLGLGPGRDDAAQQSSDREPGLPADRDRQHSRLIESPLGLPPPRQRHPRHDVGPRWNARRHRCAERSADAAHPSVLQVMHRGAGRTLERERCPGLRDLLGRALVASRHLAGRRRSAATLAPRRHQHTEPTPAPFAERPCRRTAARTARREDDVERSSQHGPTIWPGCDTRGLRAGRSRSVVRRRER